MGKHARCCVGGSSNDKRYPERFIKHSNVINKLTFHKFPANEETRKQWENSIGKGRILFEGEAPSKSFVCSNHFVDGKPTQSNPCPELFLTKTENESQSTPSKRRKPPLKRRSDENIEPTTINDINDNEQEQEILMSYSTSSTHE